MSYQLYIPQTDKYKTHFTLMCSKRKPKDFYIVRPAKVGSGAMPVVTVTPTEGKVTRAKADIEREKEEHISEVLLSFSFYKQTPKEEQL